MSQTSKGECMAQARALVSGASYDADTVKKLGQAFDAAWDEIAANYSSTPAVEAARLKLANIILSFAAEGERDPEQLKARAVRTMNVDGP